MQKEELWVEIAQSIPKQCNQFLSQKTTPPKKRRFWTATVLEKGVREEKRGTSRSIRGQRKHCKNRSHPKHCSTWCAGVRPCRKGTCGWYAPLADASLTVTVVGWVQRIQMTRRRQGPHEEFQQGARVSVDPWWVSAHVPVHMVGGDETLLGDA